MVRTAIPPTTPPTIAPIGVDDDDELLPAISEPFKPGAAVVDEEVAVDLVERPDWAVEVAGLDAGRVVCGGVDVLGAVDGGVDVLGGNVEPATGQVEPVETVTVTVVVKIEVDTVEVTCVDPGIV